MDYTWITSIRTDRTNFLTFSCFGIIIKKSGILDKIGGNWHKLGLMRVGVRADSL